MYTDHPQLWLSELSPDGLSLVGDMHPLQGPTHRYQCGLLEAPYLFHHAPSNAYILFFSSGTFTNGTYATSYSISHNGLFGPYKCPPKPLLETDRLRSVMGPGGACVLRGVENEHFIVFHAREREEGNRRTCVQRICFSDDGTPYLSSRPNCDKRLRLGAEQEDDMQHFDNQLPQSTHEAGPGHVKTGSAVSKLLRKVKANLDSDSD